MTKFLSVITQFVRSSQASMELTLFKM